RDDFRRFPVGVPGSDQVQNLGPLRNVEEQRHEESMLGGLDVPSAQDEVLLANFLEAYRLERARESFSQAPGLFKQQLAIFSFHLRFEDHLRGEKRLGAAAAKKVAEMSPEVRMLPNLEHFQEGRAAEVRKGSVEGVVREERLQVSILRDRIIL